MSETKKKYEHAIPFAMEPVVYDFSINENGTFANLLEGNNALMPEAYYTLHLPQLLKKDLHSLSECQQNELSIFNSSVNFNINI